MTITFPVWRHSRKDRNSPSKTAVNEPLAPTFDESQDEKKFPHWNRLFLTIIFELQLLVLVGHLIALGYTVHHYIWRTSGEVLQVHTFTL